MVAAACALTSTTNGSVASPVSPTSPARRRAERRSRRLAGADRDVIWAGLGFNLRRSGEWFRPPASTSLADVADNARELQALTSDMSWYPRRARVAHYPWPQRARMR